MKKNNAQIGYEAIINSFLLLLNMTCHPHKICHNSTLLAYICSHPCLENKRILYSLKWKGRHWKGGRRRAYMHTYISIYII